MGYRKVKYERSEIGSCESFEGETIEQKMERILDNNEPITDGAPEIFTERRDGVIAAYNIRTDRFEIACDAMNSVAGSIAAKREGIAKKKEEEAKEPIQVDMKKVGGDESGA